MPQLNTDDHFSQQNREEAAGDTGPTADEIGEHAVAAFFRNTWGEPVAPVRTEELTAFPNPHVSSGVLRVAGLTDIARITSALFKSDIEGTPPMRRAIPPELIKRRAEVREYAAKILGSERTANTWFERPMAVALGRRRPAEHLQTLEGCDAVEEFLRSLYPPEDNNS